jgi:hypothetical protein
MNPHARRWLHRATQPQWLFPALLLLVLGALWGVVFHLLEVERATAKRRC